MSCNENLFVLDAEAGVLSENFEINCGGTSGDITGDVNHINVNLENLGIGDGTGKTLYIYKDGVDLTSIPIFTTVVVCRTKTAVIPISAAISITNKGTLTVLGTEFIILTAANTFNLGKGTSENPTTTVTVDNTAGT